VEGETRVDLWGGHVDEAGSAPWTEDTLSLVFSVTKAATALCAHLLVERGELDLHAKVTHYWPEFGQQGKEDATVAMMLNHSVGLPAFRDPIKPGGYYDWDYMVGRLEQEAPFWKPGIRNGYHMISFGWTVGELVRRVSGKSLGTFFADEFARPLGLDFWIGLPEALEPRVSHMIPFLPGPEGPFTDFTKALIGDPTSIPALSWLNSGGYSPDAREAHAAEIGGGGGISNARSLVRLFEPLADGGGALFSRDSVTRMSQVSMATGDDATLCMPTRFALGFMKSMDNRHRPFGDIESCILGDRAFGHVGAGGSLGFADPDCALAFGYTMNRMGAGLLLNVRGQGLVDAAYRAVGFRTNAPGVWVP
jgi:CubicO group peptidase (beta-lactamase class C family)